MKARRSLELHPKERNHFFLSRRISTKKYVGGATASIISTTHPSTAKLHLLARLS